MKFYKTENKLPKKEGLYLCKVDGNIWPNQPSRIFYNLLLFENGEWLFDSRAGEITNLVKYWAELPDINEGLE